MNIRIVCIAIILGLIASIYSAIAASQPPLKIVVRVFENPDLKTTLTSLAKEIEETAALYQTSNQKAYWESEGKKSFAAMLRAEGYYSATIETEISEQKQNSIIFHIEPRQRYKLSEINIKHAKGSNLHVALPNIDKFGLKRGQYAIADKLIAVQEEMLKAVEKNNCLLSLSVSHTATINHFDNVVDITYLIDAGPNATIEKVSYKGLKKIKEDYVRQIVGLKTGQCFKQSYITKARGDLQKSGLFASTSPTVPNATNKDGSVPVVFNLTERKFRSLKAGASYGTDLGLGLTFGWEHRNYFGSGEELKIDSFVNQMEQTVEANYTEKYYRRRDQKLLLGSKFENKKSKAFNDVEISVFGFLEREYSNKWSGGFGARFAHSKVKTDKKTKHFFLLSTPVFLKLDTRKNILNPKNGHEIKVEVAPFFSINKQEKPFFKAQISGAKYFAFKTKLNPVIAVRGAFGSILGVGSVKPPVNEKFYVGGAQSLRGYEYQFAGDLNTKKNPVGGRSFIETSVELRLNMTDTIGIVGFLDSGRAYSAITPDLNSSPLMHGAGFGFRYMTDFGPIRADIGFPLNGRKFIDKAYQLYFGIGQSF